MNGYEIVAQEIEKFREEYAKTHNNYWPCEIFVIFDYKYAWEKDYTHATEYCFSDCGVTEWADDWYEGQTDIVVKHIIALDDIEDLIGPHARLEERVHELEDKNETLKSMINELDRILTKVVIQSKPIILAAKNKEDVSNIEEFLKRYVVNL